MNGSWSRAYAAVAASAIALFAVFAPGVALGAVWQVALGWLAAAVIVIAARRHPKMARRCWLLMASGVFLNSSGIGVQAYLTRGGRTIPTPSVVDACFLGLYPGLIIGLLILIRSRSDRREWSSLLDVLTISCGLALLDWILIVRPAVGSPSLTPLGQLTVASYPLFDIVVLSLLLRLFLTSGARGTPFRVMIAAVSCFLIADLTWSVLYQVGVTPSLRASDFIESVSLVAYCGIAFAAAHPAAGRVADKTAQRGTNTNPVTLLALSVATLVAPSALLIEVARHHVSDGIAISIGSIGMFVLVVIRMSILLRKVEDQAHRLDRMARLDDLTRLPNRRDWFEGATALLQRPVERLGPVTLLMLDIDHFKRFNDTFGHPAGDDLLREMAQAWRRSVRSGDLLARYGGEEFILLLPDTDAETGASIARRFRRDMPSGQTFSAGIATWNRIETLSALIGRADTALYEAKRRGRDQAAFADPAAARLGSALPADGQADRPDDGAGHETTSVPVPLDVEVRL